ncbi:hypothetical protein CKAN_01364400 [Cinnamomum micranthum f. kanehirae]|uniref:Uncharacterized protein n=1 Tax=Cinnamomum micranthum f. kanehirae TaxID=337451 RepID=A0A3S3MRK0_9MAGN|nr:hypothetical protein CKAN_01364400 [Cinnamomum micranthum f. kanehirae]
MRREEKKMKIGEKKEKKKVLKHLGRYFENIGRDIVKTDIFKISADIGRDFDDIYPIRYLIEISDRYRPIPDYNPYKGQLAAAAAALIQGKDKWGRAAGPAGIWKTDSRCTLVLAGRLGHQGGWRLCYHLTRAITGQSKAKKRR